MKTHTIRQRLLQSTMIGGAALMALVAAPAVVMLTPTVAAAQDFTTGTLAGTVTDTSGAPVSGATVTVTQNGRSQSRTFTTDANGRFRASQIPVGGYTVQVASGGFETYTDSNVSVTLGGTADYEFTIGRSGGESTVDEVVVVGTRTAAVDFDRTTTGITVDVQETFDRIPTQRNVAAIQLLAPSTTQGDTAFGNQVSIGGSSVAENVYYVNGLNITNFRNFLGGNTVPFEFYQQIDVKTGGYQAEFGRSTGGAVIAVTRSGSDDFHGGVNYYTELDSLRGESPDTFNGDPNSTITTLDSQEESSRAETNVWVSGPIWRDHAYFFAFYNWRDFELNQFDANGTQTTTLQDDPFYGGKLDFYLNPDHRLELTYFKDDQSVTTRTLEAGGDSFDSDTFQGGETKISKYTGTFTDWFTLSALYGEGAFNQSIIGDLDTEASVVDNLGAIRRGNTALVIETGEDTRKMYRVDADLYFDDLFGDHHFRIGYDREDLASSIDQSYSGDRYYRYYVSGPGGALGGAVPANTLYVRDRNLQNQGAFSTEQTAYYIQDAWDVTDQLSLQIGLRAEKFNNKNAAGETFVETDFDLSPRLGFTYDVFGDRSTSLKGFFGRYYIPIAANTNIRMAGQELFTQDWYIVSGVGGAYPGTAAGLQTCLSASPRNGCVPTFAGPAVLNEVLSPGTVPQSQSLVSQNLEAQYQDEFIFGIEHEITGMGMLDGWTVGASFVYRDLQKAMEDFDTSYIIDAYCASEGIAPGDCGQINGAGYVLLNPGSDLVITPDSTTFPFLAGQTITISSDILDIPEAQRTYKALELTFERPWDGVWSLQGSAVFADSKGNIEGGVKSDNGQDDTGLTQDFDEPGWTDGAYGYLPNHRGQTYKLFGSLALNESMTVGFNATLQSPRKYGCIGTYPYADDRASQSTVTAWYCNGVATPRGSQFEGEWFKNVDASFAWNIDVGMPGRVQFRADVFNIFDLSSATRHQEVGEDGPGSPSIDYRRVTGYQTPRTVRLGLSYQF